ncbi:MAG: hypothetical protein ED557_11990 [Balneola sp.]|nr:MAG: hypothetical protein ED557_11990 [Balneola sp.]
MKEFLETMFGKILLAVIVIGVWGVNVVNFSELTSSNTSPIVQQVQSVDLDELTVPEKIGYSYSASGRDPFRMSGTAPQTVAAPEPEPIQPEPEAPMPRLSLTGIMDQTAVILDDQGQPYFVESGESFRNGILVMAVVRDSVLLEYNDKKFTLKLNDN